ncbi:hypothetical protein B0H14DRAFT_865936 [Mycena olivaceomarginata]|nr:hypothetical protein B0H14DRAFT_865936 [Mycena olivaceomarginata]
MCVRFGTGRRARHTDVGSDVGGRIQWRMGPVGVCLRRITIQSARAYRAWMVPVVCVLVRRVVDTQLVRYIRCSLQGWAGCVGSPVASHTMLVFFWRRSWTFPVLCLSLSLFPILPTALLTPFSPSTAPGSHARTLAPHALRHQHIHQWFRLGLEERCRGQEKRGSDGGVLEGVSSYFLTSFFRERWGEGGGLGGRKGGV